MAEALALSAAVVFGLVHFFSGLLARRTGSFGVAAIGQLGGAILVAAGAVLMQAITGSHLTAVDLAWGSLSGLGTGVGVAFLYRGLATGKMSVVVPLSDVGTVALPVLVGVAVLSERPTTLAWAGVIAAFPALWLVSRARPGAARGPTRGTVDGLVAGAGFALQFIAISRVDLDVGLWPILAARLVAVATIVVLARQQRAPLAIAGHLMLPALVVGAAGSVAIILYLLATQQQLLAVATVLAALYPAIPVILALTVLHERITKAQRVGLVLTGSAIALMALG